MKLLSFEHADRPSFGVVESERIFDLGPAIGDRFADLRFILAADALGVVAAPVRCAGVILSGTWTAFFISGLRGRVLSKLSQDTAAGFP